MRGRPEGDTNGVEPTSTAICCANELSSAGLDGTTGERPSSWARADSCGDIESGDDASGMASSATSATLDMCPGGLIASVGCRLGVVPRTGRLPSS